MIKKLISGIIAICLTCVVAYNLKSEYSYEYDIPDAKIVHLLKKKPVMLHEGEFVSGQSSLIQGIIQKLAKKGLAQMSLFGVHLKKSKDPIFLDVLVNSPGGNIGILMQRIQFVQYLNKNNVFLKCYITDAHSAAFTFIVTSCKIRVLVKGAKLSQHRAFFAGDDEKHESPTTRIVSYKLARLEAKALSKDWFKWYALTRKEDLHEFTEEELKEHGIIHDVF